MKYIILLFPCFLLIAMAAKAQSTGVVSYKYLGVQFTIPEGWAGQEVQSGFLIGSNTEPGFAFLSTLEAKSMDEIRTLGQLGIMEADGTHLQLQGQLEQISDSSLGGEYSGTLQGSPAKAYMLAVLNPHGNGVLIMAATSPEQYASTHRQLAIQLANSLVFSKAETPPMAEQWKQKFANAKLTYMDSYYSSGPGYDGYATGGGYEQKSEIHLCAQGYFKYNSSSSMSIDTGGAFGNTHGNQGGDGNWEIVGNHQGEPVLRLNFHNGEVHEYTLAYQDNKTLLNGVRYYVTYVNDGPQYSPDCF